MRNLKKVLSLVLAVAMMVSICVVGAGAVNYDDFTDKNQITKTQAVETLVSLDVINGYDNGATFNPTGNVTRAEMATMICRVLAGGDNMIADATKAVPTYTDVPNTHWAVTYIEYCTSLGIVSGKGNNQYDPNANVTAAEAAKMVMTALGYNADIEGFKGIGWDINTMAKANTLKLLTNLQNEISANVAVTREQVAQLIYNALTTPMVQYYEGTVANIWIGAGNTNNKYYETLLETKFNAEKVVGVVVANEYADLDDTEPLAAGRTRMIVLGTDNEPTKQEMTFNVSTTLDDIGMSAIVYRDKSSNRVIYGNTQDTGMNIVTEFTAATKDITKGDDAVDKSAKTAEQYINFGNGITTTYTAKARFTVKLPADIEYVEVAIPEVTFNRGNTVSFENVDVAMMTILEAAFDEVNIRNNDAATLTNADDYDTFEAWCDDYLNVKSTTTTNGLSALENENGNYIKVIDYNNDGDIDYVLKTIYTATDVGKVAKNGTITLSTESETLADTKLEDQDVVNALTDKYDVVTDDELATGDIVLYAVIDGTAYVYLADMTTAQIDKVNRNTLTATTTDGDEYVQSGVNGAEYIDNDNFVDGVKNLEGKTSYDLYFDRYGYLVAFEETATSGNFTLLTDGYYQTGRTENTYAVMAYVDGKLTDTDVTAGGDLFIDTEASSNRWGALKDFGELNDSNTQAGKAGTIWTTVASLSDDGELTTVGNVFNKKTVDMIDAGTTIVDRTGITNGIVYESNTGKNGDAYVITSTTDAEVRALSTTVYYFVYEDGKDITVKEYVGYANLPKLSDTDKEHIEDVYAVGTKVERNSTVSNTYYTADVVVVEFDQAYKTNAERVFIYDSPEVVNNVKTETLDVIREDGTKGTVEVDLSKSDLSVMRGYAPAKGKIVLPGLYYLWETSTEGVYTIEPMSREEIAKDYALGTVYTSTYTSKTDWTDIHTWEAVWNSRTEGNDTVWYIDEVREDGNNVSYKNVDSTYYYALDYTKVENDATGYLDYTAKLNPDEDDDVVLAEQYKNGKNTVLVSYDKNNIVYAISFANDSEFAQYLWEIMLPEYEAPAADPVVSFSSTTAPAGATLPADIKTKSGEDVTIAADTLKQTGYVVTVNADPTSAGNYKELIAQADGGYTLTNVTGNVELVVTYTAKEYTFTVNLGEHVASATVNGTTYTAPVTVHYGDTVTFAATPEDNYTITSSYSATYDIEGNVEVTLVAARNTVNVTVSGTGVTTTTTSVNSGIKVSDLDDIVLSAATGYTGYPTVTSIKIGNTTLDPAIHYTVTDGTVDFADNNATRNLTVDGDITITCPTLSKRQVVVTITNTASANLTGATADANNVNYGETFTFTATPANPGDVLSFSNTTANEVTYNAVTDTYTVTLTNVTAAKTIEITTP